MRTRACWVLLAAAVPGLLFAPVFGLWTLVPPIAAVLVACYAVVELCIRVPALQPWRPAVALVAGLLALTEVSLFATTLSGLPTAASVRALVAGVTDSWQLTLQSTWPVRPDAELLLFVPILVLFTAMLGIELLRRPAVAVLPSLVLLVLSQAFVAVSGTVAILVAFGYAAVVAGLFLSRARSAIVLTIALSLVGGVAVTAFDTEPAYSVQQNHSAQTPLPRAVSPLSEIAARLSNPDAPVFTYTSNAPVDHWRLVVLDQFNGVTWTPTDQYRTLGAEIGPPAGVTVPTASYSAHLTVPGDAPWLPSQAMPASVNGVAPMIDQATGMLLMNSSAGPVEYDLRWWELDTELDKLNDAGVSSDIAPGGLGIVPPGIGELARTATGNARPTFRTALLLEQYLSRNYRVATGTELPTGSGWPQLSEFLLDTKRGRASSSPLPMWRWPGSSASRRGWPWDTARHRLRSTARWSCATATCSLGRRSPWPVSAGFRSTRPVRRAVPDRRPPGWRRSPPRHGPNCRRPTACPTRRCPQQSRLANQAPGSISGSCCCGWRSVCSRCSRLW